VGLLPLWSQDASTLSRYAQLTLSNFDAEDAKILAIEQVEHNASALWMSAARHCIEQAARYRDTFTTDAIWQQLEAAQVEAPHEPRAMGAAMRIAQRRGIIEATGKYEPSERIINHARPLMVWRSVSRSGY